MKTLYLILARGGSKRLPKKNIKRLLGKPLICYTIDVALELTNNDNIYVSTDDDEIINVVENYGLKTPFKRPLELAKDDTSSEDAIFHAINFYEKTHGKLDSVILLQPTSPLRTARHIREAINLYNKNTNMVVSVKKASTNSSANFFLETNNGYLIKSTSESRKKNIYQYNGAIYIINVKALKKYKKLTLFDNVVKYEMEKVNSIDIDNLSDWTRVEKLIKKRLKS